MFKQNGRVGKHQPSKITVLSAVLILLTWAGHKICGPSVAILGGACRVTRTIFSEGPVTCTKLKVILLPFGTSTT